MKRTIKKLRKNNYNRTKVNNLKFSYKISQLSNEKYKILFLFFAIIGIIIGTISYRYINDSQFNQIIISGVDTLNSGNVRQIFLYFFRLDLLFFIVSFFVGTSFIGSSISFISPLLKCIYIGYFSSYLYSNFELKGVLFALLLYPCLSITTTSLIYACNENVYMSKYIFNVLNGKNSLDNISIKLFLLRYLLLISINVVCITITTLLISVLALKININ